MLITAEKSWAEAKAFWDSFPDRIQEENVREYVLPDPFECFDGRTISSGEEWLSLRRPELLKFYQDKLYGVIPPGPDQLELNLIKETETSLFAGAVRREYLIQCKQDDGRSFSFKCMLYLPAKAEKTFSVIIAPNFYGNHTVSDEPDIPVDDHWLPYQWRERFLTMDMRETYRCDPDGPDRAWQTGCAEALRRGYGVVTFCYEALMPDNGYFFDRSIYQLFCKELDYMSEKRNYGSISAWAWGISRVIDSLLKMPETAESKIIVMGHSRLGKTALWAGVNDERIALTISNDSGCCGAKLFHRNFGENLRLIAYWRPYWLSLGAQEYCEREEELPVDQHELIGMIAPRLVYIASASDDPGADPKGEFLAAWHAGKIYSLFGLDGLQCPEELPPCGTVLHAGSIAYHLRKGEHGITEEDWKHYLDYADKMLAKGGL